MSLEPERPSLADLIRDAKRRIQELEEWRRRLENEPDTED